MNYVWAFVIGGAFCVIGQLLIDFTKLTPARVLVCFVVAGVVLSALDLYDPLAEFAGAGATVPLLGFWASACAGRGGCRGRKRPSGCADGRLLRCGGRCDSQPDGWLPDEP